VTATITALHIEPNCDEPNDPVTGKAPRPHAIRLEAELGGMTFVVVVSPAPMPGFLRAFFRELGAAVDEPGENERETLRQIVRDWDTDGSSAEPCLSVVDFVKQRHPGIDKK
jgi:hypothetical protein